MAKINSNRSMITLNINYINMSIKRQRLAEKMKKSPTTSCLQKTHFNYDVQQIESKRMKKDLSFKY